METLFRTDDLPAAERFDYWRECQSRTHAPFAMSSDHHADYRASQRTLRLGPLTVWSAAFQPATFHRTPALIRRSDPDIYHVGVLLKGDAGNRWGEHELPFRPYDVATNDSSRPVVIQAKGGPHSMIEHLGVEIPKDLVALPRLRADQVIGRKLSARQGVGALLAGFVTRLTADTASYRADDATRLGTVVADLVSALFAHALDAEKALTPETRRRELTLRVRAFVERHLHDPRLSPRSVAAAHNISTSYLHRLFQDEDETVAAWIRRRRLERAREALADPTQLTVPIHRIAGRAGFSDHSVFTRAFRSHYGVSPRDYRRQALSAVPRPLPGHP